MEIDPWFVEHLVCPTDKQDLFQKGDKLICRNDHEYPIVQSVPIMLTSESSNTVWKVAEDGIEEVIHTASDGSVDFVDPYVKKIILDTNSHFYRHLVGKLARYPVPEFPFPLEPGKILLDIGCNWARWCIAASKLGCSAVGVDPRLEAILAAKRVAKQLGVKARYLVGDARFLPFRQNTFDYCYSYSVFQHLAKQDVKDALVEIGYALKPDGISMIHMLNRYGLRSFYVQLRRGFREAIGSETRYWAPSELMATFSRSIGPTELSLGSFFTQAQRSDEDMFTLRDRTILRIAETLKEVNERFPLFTRLGDNVFLRSRAKAK